MIEQKNINKYNGQCMDSALLSKCLYWITEGEYSHCALFGVVKFNSLAFNICNKIYGLTYNGLP